MLLSLLALQLSSKVGYHSALRIKVAGADLVLCMWVVASLDGCLTPGQIDISEITTPNLSGVFGKVRKPCLCDLLIFKAKFKAHMLTVHLGQVNLPDPVKSAAAEVFGRPPDLPQVRPGFP